jgi:hypothetical protein
MARTILVVFFCLVSGASITAQTELGRMSAPSKSWTMLSLHRVWTPQYNGFPNGGFGVNAFFSVDDGRRSWLGLSIMGTGLDKRTAMGLMIGAGWWIIGDSRLGAFGYAMSGLGISSATGLTGFNFFSDPTTFYGLASHTGLGGSVEIFTNFKIHLNGYAMWFTTDGGPTPLGLQVGLTLGGR